MLWKTPSRLLSRVVNEGIRYLVPRDDGHVLAGSSVEDVGFDCHTTDEVIDELKTFSHSLLRQLVEHRSRQNVGRLTSGRGGRIALHRLRAWTSERDGCGRPLS